MHETVERAFQLADIAAEMLGDVGQSGFRDGKTRLPADLGAEQAQARAALEMLSREREALRQRTSTSLSSSFARVQAADAQVRLYSASLVPSANEVRELYRDSYREGAVGILNLIDALRSEREVQLGYARALLDLERALADLEQAAGVELNDGPPPD